MKKSKMILKVLNLNASIVKNCVALSYVRLYSDNSTEKRLYIFSKSDTEKMKTSKVFKQFTSTANIFLTSENLDAQARKNMLTKNTHYDKTHTAIAKLLNKTDFVASNDRRKVEVKKVVVAVAKAKKNIAKKVSHK
jgi:hypothetical protein